MEHADKIHKEYYRIPIGTRKIEQVSRLLEIGIGRDTGKLQKNI